MTDGPTDKGFLKNVGQNSVSPTDLFFERFDRLVRISSRTCFLGIGAFFLLAILGRTKLPRRRLTSLVTRLEIQFVCAISSICGCLLDAVALVPSSFIDGTDSPSRWKGLVEEVATGFLGLEDL